MTVVDSPTQEMVDFFTTEPVIRVTSKVDLYESDGITPFAIGARVLEGGVSLDWARDERRTLDVRLANVDRVLSHPGDMDYSKIVKVYRGIIHPTLGALDFPQGEFLIDNFDEESFPHVLAMSCRDYTKKLLKDKFPTTTTFRSGQPVEDLIKAIALNGGITKFRMPTTGKVTTKDHTFERGVQRWPAIKEIAGAHSYEVYFDAGGYLTMEMMQDPATTPPYFTFKTGPGGTLTKINRRANDERVYNHIVVTGEGTTPPIYAVAENNDPTSRTSIQAIGRRTYEFVSQFFTTTAQAQETADNFLKVHSLEQYEASLEGRVLPWLDVGRVAGFLDPEPREGAPNRYMLDTLGIPLKMGRMSAGLKRVVNIG